MSAPRKRTSEEVLAPHSLTCSIPEAMTLLGSSRKTVEAMCGDGRLHSFPVGRTVKIGVASIRRLVGMEGV